MFSKDESKQLRQEFWTSFGKSYPRKWILYDTKIKGLVLKFHFDVKKAMVAMTVEGDLAQRIAIWENLLSLQSILKEEYLPEAVLEDSYLLKNHKEISIIFVEKEGVSIHDKNTWRETMIFLNEKMTSLEAFFVTYREIIES
ncbi:DUF4268 domain-containing protein [Aggregatimonas sangjinii]|uniref:DUF4268 domain-containing protein n=1 Tax=Aggregatimonas sangjinii TaxID=2583587 RepID=A0A5B7SPP0_9FLAO|nr:DUF4268 domain-containing protein [Aggregatimonas sangjinii]QCX00556.1 DUF4268 domain-containing protein [Aggregatimonas sangjinii]